MKEQVGNIKQTSPKGESHGPDRTLSIQNFGGIV